MPMPLITVNQKTLEIVLTTGNCGPAKFVLSRVQEVQWVIAGPT